MQKIKRYLHPLSKLIRKRIHYDHNTLLPKHIEPLITLPKVDYDTLAKECDYLVLDLETTGLDHTQDRILSIGWVNIDNNQVDLSSAAHLFVNSDSQIKPETAVINHITPQMLEQGVSMHDAINAFLEAAHNRVIVAHATIIERNFINAYLAKTYHLIEPPLLWLDTLCIEKNLCKALHQQDIDVTLAETRKRYQLPEYNGHNALIDAVSTAELLLAQQNRAQNRLRKNHQLTLARLYKLSE